MTKISDLSDGGTLQSTDELIVVRSGGNARAKMNTLPDMTVSQSPSVPSSSAQIFYNSTKGAVLRGQGSTSDVRLENDLGQAALTVKTGTKLVGVATASPTHTLDVNGTLGVTHSENNGVRITANDTVGNSSYTAALLNYDVSGTDTLSADRNHIALYIDVDSSASGGNTSEEHRLFGTQVQVKSTGDSDIIYGVYANAEAEISTGQVSSLYGIYGRAESDGVGGQVSNSYGVLGAAVVNNDAGVTQTSAHGVFGKCTVGSSNAADVNNLMGAYFEIQLDNPAVDNVPVNYMYGTRIEIDLNDNSSGGSYDLSGTTSYLLYANYSVISGGVMPGNAYGLYINDTVENYFRGSLRVDNGAVFNEQGLAASDFRVEGNTNSNLLFVNAGDDQVIIGAAASLSPSDYGLYARNGLIVGNFSGAGAGFAVYRGASAQTRITHSSTNGFLSTGGVPLHFRTALTGTAYRLSMKTNELVVNESGASAYDFRVESNTSTHAFFVDASSGAGVLHSGGTSATPYTQTTGAGQLAYSIDNGSAFGTLMLSNNADNGWSMMYANKYAYTSGDDRRYIVWYLNGSALANLQLNSAGTQVQYNTTSDRRLKDNIIDIDDGITRLKQLKPRRYQWVGTELNAEGFIADEVAGIVPEAVEGTPNEVDDEGKPVYMQIEYSKYIPLITAALQESIHKIENLETRLSNIEN